MPWRSGLSAETTAVDEDELKKIIQRQALEVMALTAKAVTLQQEVDKLKAELQDWANKQAWYIKEIGMLRMAKGVPNG